MLMPHSKEQKTRVTLPLPVKTQRRALTLTNRHLACQDVLLVNHTFLSIFFVVGKMISRKCDCTELPPYMVTIYMLYCEQGKVRDLHNMLSDWSSMVYQWIL